MFGWKDHHHGDREGRGRGKDCAGRRGEWGGRSRHGFRGFERGFSGRMFGPGDLRLVLMVLLEERPRHGYDLIKAVEESFEGAYAPSPGAVYPTLSMLEDEGLLSSASDDSNKRIYSLTEAGKAWLDENRTAANGVMDRLRLAARMMSGQVAPESVREALQTLRQAVMMKPGDWSLEEEARVVELLMNVVREVSKRQ